MTTRPVTCTLPTCTLIWLKNAPSRQNKRYLNSFFKNFKIRMLNAKDRIRFPSTKLLSSRNKSFYYYWSFDKCISSQNGLTIKCSGHSTMAVGCPGYPGASTVVSWPPDGLLHCWQIPGTQP